MNIVKFWWHRAQVHILKNQLWLWGGNVGSGGHPCSHMPSLWTHVTDTGPGSSVPTTPHQPMARPACTIWVWMAAKNGRSLNQGSSLVKIFMGYETREQSWAKSLGKGCICSSTGKETPEYMPLTLLSQEGGLWLVIVADFWKTLPLLKKKKSHFLSPHGLVVPAAQGQGCFWRRPRAQLAKPCFSMISNCRINTMPLFCLNYWTIRTSWGVSLALYAAIFVVIKRQQENTSRSRLGQSFRAIKFLQGI